MDDVICGVAFGIDGGPPVLLVNHSAHIFWTGASIADLVVNCRGSALEGIWATAYRGIARYATVPIPLLGAGSHPSTQAQAIVKREAKKRIGIPEDSIVILTVGASFKYLPLDGLDFVGVCESVLKELPGAFLLAVGVNDDPRWRAASARSGSRMRALGTIPQSRLGAIHNAADVYIEAFPVRDHNRPAGSGSQRNPCSSSACAMSTAVRVGRGCVGRYFAPSLIP